MTTAPLSRQHKEAYAYFKFPIAFSLHGFFDAIYDFSEDPLNDLSSDLLSVIQLYETTGVDAALAFVNDLFEDDAIKCILNQEAVERSIGSFTQILLIVIKTNLPNLPIREIKSIAFTFPSTFSTMVVGKDEEVRHWFNYNEITRV